MLTSLDLPIGQTVSVKNVPGTDLVMVAGARSIAIVNVAHPDSPHVVRSDEVSGVVDMAVFDDTVLVSLSDGRMVAYFVQGDGSMKTIMLSRLGGGVVTAGDERVVVGTGNRLNALNMLAGQVFMPRVFKRPR